MAKQEKEKKEKKRAFFITLFFHGILVAIALIPMTQYIQQNNSTVELAEESMPQKIYTELKTEVIMSNKNNRSSSRSGEKPLPTTDPKPPAPQDEPKPVVFDDNIKAEPIPTPETPNNNDNILAPILDPWPTPDPGSLNGNGSGGNGNGNTNLGGNGNGSHGNGTLGNGNGEGKFSRKVTFRPEAELKQLTKQRGTVVIRLSINRDGKVIDAKYMKELSSIQHDNMGNAAAKIAKKYVFDRDYKVAEIQYCNITIIFEEQK